MSFQNCIYMTLTYEQYKSLEEQMRLFKETKHLTTDGFYHKSLRLKIPDGPIFEFHGPIVKAAEVQYVEPEQEPDAPKPETVHYTSEHFATAGLRARTEPYRPGQPHPSTGGEDVTGPQPYGDGNHDEAF